MRTTIDRLLMAGAVLAPMLLPGAAAGALARATGGPEVSVIAGGLRIPWDIAFLPDGRALVTERGGTVRWVDGNRRLLPEPAATVPVSESGDGGLLGVAVDPGFAPSAPYVYLSHTSDGRLRVGRWRVEGDALVREAEVLTGPPTGGVHNSARLRFGPDGALHLGTGDGGEASAAQSPTDLRGKILRIAPGLERTTGAAPTVIATGLRHPQGLAWQPGSGRFWVTDHGPSGFDGPSGDDELNLIVPGADYGWPLVRGADQSPYRGPSHLWAETIAPASIAFVTLPGSTWTGDALVTGLKGQTLRRLTFDGDRVTGEEPLLNGVYGRLRAVAEAPDGAIWVTTSNRDPLGVPGPADDRILRIVPPAAPSPGAGIPSPALGRTAPPGAGGVGAAGAVSRLSAPRRGRVGRVLTVRVVFRAAPRGAVVLERRRGRAWITVTAVRRPGRTVLLRYRPATAGAVRLRVRFRTAAGPGARSLVIRVAAASRAEH